MSPTLLFSNNLFSFSSTKESFADESWSGNLWHRTNVIAHIESPKDLSWMFEIEQEARKLGYFGEVKSYFAYQVINHFDTKRKNSIWRSIQDIPILLIDPKYYLSQLGVKIINQCSYSFEICGIKFQINRSDQRFNEYEEFLQELLSERILIDSPLPDIEIAIGNISQHYDLFPSMYEFNPKRILKLLDYKTPKRQVMNVVKLSTRLQSAFFELCDKNTINSTIEELSYFGEDLFWPFSHFYRNILIQSISKNRYFDEGDPKSINFIRELFSKPKTSLNRDVFGNYLFIPESKIEEIKSENDIRMRASDVVSGIARMIYYSEGLKGITNGFSCVFFNGRRI